MREAIRPFGRRQTRGSGREVTAFERIIPSRRALSSTSVK